MWMALRLRAPGDTRKGRTGGAATASARRATRAAHARHPPSPSPRGAARLARAPRAPPSSTWQLRAVAESASVRGGGGGGGPADAAMAAALLKVHDFGALGDREAEELTKRPRKDFKKVFGIVEPIVEDVRAGGDAAVRALTRRFDLAEGAGGDDFEVCVPVSSLPWPELEPAVREAFDVAIENVRTFHERQAVPRMSVETMEGVRCSRISKPIDAVGLYVPGGTAVLPSTAAMLGVPAAVAGCGTVVLATPPRPDGSICPEVVYVAKKVGVGHLLKAGGAQAVAAMAFGTESCPKVHKIFGPGNQFVTAAKMILQNSEAMVSIDMPAGPSEVLVIADARADVRHVAADLLSQAEHGADSQSVLVAMEGFDTGALQAELAAQLRELPRGEVTAEALANSFVVAVRDRAQAVQFSNSYAPEHLIINVDVEEAEAEWMPLITNAGSVFLGRNTPESVGDYASGTNHVLPTYGYARMYSGVSLDSFQKKITVQSLTERGLRNLGPHVATMAAVEGLDAHRNAVLFRLEDIGLGGADE